MKEEILQKFFYSEEGRRIYSLCLDITIYTDINFPDCSDGVLKFYNEFMALYRDSVKWYSNENMADEKKITQKIFTMIPSWFCRTDKMRKNHGLYMHSGPQADDHRPPAFDIFSTSMGHMANFLRMVLPVDFITGDVTRLIELTKRAVRFLPFLSGHAGYAFYWNYISQGANTKAGSKTGPLLMRHHGIDIGVPMDTSLKTQDAIKGVNWLTLLNFAFCDKLGGVEDIQKALGKDIPVHLLDNGIIIQAGPKPEVGDVNIKDNIIYYHKVGRVVRPIRIAEHRQIWGTSKEQTANWLERFDE